MADKISSQISNQQEESLKLKLLNMFAEAYNHDLKLSKDAAEKNIQRERIFDFDKKDTLYSRVCSEYVTIMLRYRGETDPSKLFGERTMFSDYFSKIKEDSLRKKLIGET